MEYCLSDKFISAGKDMCDLTHMVAAPYIRKNFELASLPDEAVMTVCGLGFYEAYVNGVNITKGLLSPYISNPDQVMDYDVYDIKPYLKQGKNTLAFILGNGMQNCFGGYIWDFQKAAFRSAPKLAVWCGLLSGDELTVIEADESFRCNASPILYDDLRHGEVYDANREIPGWNLPDFDDSEWTPAPVVPTPSGIRTVCGAKPIVRTKELKAVSIKQDTIIFNNREEVFEGWLYDFGENLAGVEHLKINGRKGQHIKMIFGEYVKPDGHFSVDNIRFSNDENKNLPLMIQMDEYICNGNCTEYYSPRFTYHGFRYALVCGITPEQATQDLLTYCVMNTELNKRGSFECSDETINKLQHMTENSILANFYHFPTDCPHREKNGWTADAALSSVACMLNFDPEDNYIEWLKHIRGAMREDGALPGIVPTGGWGFNWGNGPAWDQVLVHLVHLLYRFTGNKSIIEENAEAMYRYCRYIDSRKDENGLIAIGLGDWCAPHNPVKAPLVVTDSIIASDISSKAAFLLGEINRKEEADCCKKLSGSFVGAVRKELINELSVAGDCQTSQAMALYYGIFTDDEKSAAFDKLVEYIERADMHIDCGVLGARVIFRVLCDNDRSDIALKILKQKTAPSYTEWIERGETTLCEDFNTYSRSVNSLNHHFFGDISAWFIEYFGGIRVNETCKDSRNIDIKPVFADELTSASAYFGSVAVNWHRKCDEVVLDIKYPGMLNGRIVLADGYEFADGGNEKTAASGSYRVLKCR